MTALVAPWSGSRGALTVDVSDWELVGDEHLDRGDGLARADRAHRRLVQLHLRRAEDGHRLGSVHDDRERDLMSITEYDVRDHDPGTGRLLLEAADHWLIVDLTPGQPIRMTTATETEAREMFGHIEGE